MKSTVDKLSSTRAKLTIEVPFEELSEEFDRAYKKVGSQVTLPGFRKGHVPPKVIDAKLGRGPVLEEVINDMMPSRYEAACEEHNIVPLGAPEADVTKIDDPNSIEFTVEVDCRDEITLPDLSTIEVEVEPRKAPEEIAEEGTAALRERFATLKGVDRPVEKGDFVMIDLDASIDGEAVADASTKGMSHHVGSDDLIEGLDDTLVGMTKDESRTFTSTIIAGEHANEKADVTVTVTKVQEQELPELDDEFAQMASEFDTIEELKDDLQRRAVATAQTQQASQIRDAVLDKLIEEVSFDVPPALVEEQAQAQISSITSQFGGDESVLKTILESQDSSLEKFYEDSKASAEKGVRAQLLLDAIAEERNVELTQNDITEAVVAQAQQYNMEPEQFVKLVQQQGQLSGLFSEIRRNKALFSVVSEITAKDTDGNVIDDLNVFFDSRDEEDASNEADAE